MARRPIRLNDAQRKLVEENIGLVVYTLRREFGQAYASDDDNISEGMYALCRAAACYDSAAGAKFTTYAYRAIKTWAHVMARSAGMKKRNAGMRPISLDAPIRDRRKGKPSEVVGDVVKDDSPGPDILAENSINSEIFGELIRKISEEWPIVVGALSAGKKSAYFETMAVRQNVTRQAVEQKFRRQHGHTLRKYSREYRRIMYGNEDDCGRG